MVSKGFVGLCRSSVRALLGSLLAGFKFSLSLWIITCIVITCIGSIHRSQRERATLNVATAASGAFTGLGLKLRGLGVYGFRVWGAPKP